MDETKHRTLRFLLVGCIVRRLKQGQDLAGQLRQPRRRWINGSELRVARIKGDSDGQSRGGGECIWITVKRIRGVGYSSVWHAF